MFFKSKKLTITEKIDVACKDFCREHSCMSSPWDYMALIQKDGKEGYWLNPYHQSHLNCGWVTEEDLSLWLEGKGTIPMEEKWEELVFVCKLDAFLHLLHKDHYNWYEPKYYFYESREYCSKKLFDDTLTVETIKRIESFVKSCIMNLMIDESYGKTILRYDDIDFQNLRGLENEIWGLFNGLSFMGLVYFGYSNTPKERENCSWWTHLLRYESEIEWWIKSGRVTLEEAGKFFNFKRNDS